MAATPSTTPQPGFARPRRTARRLAMGLAGVALTWAVAHAAADRPWAHERIRSRAVELLRSRLPDATLGDEVAVDWLFRAMVGPLTVPASTPGAAPVLRIARLRARAALWPLLAGRVEPASIRLDEVRLAPGPGGRELRRLVERARRPAGPGTAAVGRAATPSLHLRGLVVALDRGGRTVELGPWALDVERREEGDSELLAAELTLSGGGHAEASLRRRRLGDPSPAPLRLGAAMADAGPTPAPGARREAGRGLLDGPWSLSGMLRAGPADLPAFLRTRAVAVAAGQASLTVEAEGSAGGAVASLRGRLDGLSLAGAPLGPEAVGPLDVRGEATLAFTRSNGRLTVEKAALWPAGPVLVQVSGWVSTRDDLAFSLDLDVPPVEYGALLSALPAALVPPPEAPRPPGKVGGSLALAGALRGGGPWTLQADIDLSGLKEAARRAPPSPLRSSFRAWLAGEDGPPLLVGPENPAFVPLGDLPQQVVRAITTSEDAGFFGHRGFDFEELRAALAAGVEQGRLPRGGSTITQQLAKNLYLSRDRTLARKAKEALVTLALEGTVPKARLLEIYLNLIEWGPGLHGIGPAARHYLEKDARALTPREACFLATLIPSPRRSHAALAAGVPIERWGERIDDLLRKLAAVGVLDEEALARELATPLRLAAWVPRPSPEAAGVGAPPPGSDEDPEPPAGPGEEPPPDPPAPSPHPR